MIQLALRGSVLVLFAISVEGCAAAGGASGTGGAGSVGVGGDVNGAGGEALGPAAGGSGVGGGAQATGGAASIGGAFGAGGDLGVGGDVGIGGTDGLGGAAAACTPNPSGTLQDQGEVVFDEKNCLWWMKANTSGDPLAAALTYCDGLTLGGFEDWRLPTAGETVTLFKCDNTYPPTFPIFSVAGDGIWTTTETGTVAGTENKVCGAGQSSGQFYDFGPVGGQNTRCVRGAVTLPDRPDCKTVTQICP